MYTTKSKEPRTETQWKQYNRYNRKRATNLKPKC